MPRAFRAPDGATITFPDDTADSVVAKTLGVDPTEIRRHVISDPSHVMVAAHARSLPRPKKKEPFAVSQIPNVAGMVGDVAGRAAGGTLGAGTGAVAGAPVGGVGAIPGGISGAVVGQELGGVAGSAALGSAGEMARQMIDAALGVEPPADPAKAVRDAALVQGGSSIVGSGLAKGAALTGKAAMGAALKFTPEVAQTAIREGITATRGGLDKALTLLKDYGARTAKFITQMNRSGVRFDPTDLLNRGGQSLVAEVADNQTGLGPEIMAQYKELANKFMAQWGSVPQSAAPGSGVAGLRPLGSMTPEQLQLFKTQAQKIADPIFETLNNKELAHTVTPQDQVRAKWYKSMADAAQEMLEEKAPTMLNPRTGAPMTLRESNAQTAALIRLKNQLAPQVGKGIGVAANVARRAAIPFGAAAAAGAAFNPNHRVQSGLEYGVGGAIASSPEFLSHLALLLNNPAVAATLRQVPRAGAAFMTEQR